MDLLSILGLILIFLLTTSVEFASPNASLILAVVTGLTVTVLLLSVLTRGVVAIVTCLLGAVLLDSAITFPEILDGGLPAPSPHISDPAFWHSYTMQTVQTGRGMNFILGLMTVAFAIVFAYKPSLLFSRNRPKSTDDEWAKYRVWNDNLLLADGSTEPSMHIKSIMSDIDRHLLWRYEYILAEIYGSPYLVGTEAHVPKKSTRLVRDRSSGRLVGKARFGGYFI